MPHTLRDSLQFVPSNMQYVWIIFYFCLLRGELSKRTVDTHSLQLFLQTMQHSVILPGHLLQLHRIDVKNVFTFFYFGHVFNVFNVFLSSKRFFIFKNVGKVQSGKQINKTHFQNNSNEIDL